MIKFYVLFIIGILATVVNIGSGHRKTFIASRNLGQRNNWRGEVTPCPGRKSSIQGLFPDTQVFLDKDMTTSSIAFYQDIELVFGESSLNFATERDNSCEGSQTESVFENKAPGYWWDPNSWQCDENDILNCNSAVPDLHRVPCRQDSVYIPNEEDSLYHMVFTNPAPTVAVLRKGKQNMTTSDFYSFSISEEGRQRIRKEVLIDEEESRSLLYIESEGPCYDITGCKCHLNSPFNEICRHQSRKCPRPKCKNPVTMIGFCCLKCGVDISISHNGSLAISAVQSILKTVLESDGKNVDAYIGKMFDEAFIHVYFMPKDELSSFQEAVDAFKIIFERDYNILHQHSLSSTTAQGLFGLRKGSSKSTSVVIVILCICLAIGIFGYVYRKRRVNELPFMFRRMSNRARISMRSRNTSIPSSIHIVAVETPEGRSFVNPTFMSEPPEIALQTTDRLSSQLPIPENVAVKKPQHEIANPLYEIKKDASISFKSLRRASNESTENLNDIASNFKSAELQQPIQDSVEEELTDRVIVKEEIIVDVSVNDNEDVLSTDDEIDPIEELAKSRIANIIKLEDKNEATIIKSDPVAEDDDKSENKTLNEKSIPTIILEADNEDGL